MKEIIEALKHITARDLFDMFVFVIWTIVILYWVAMPFI
jgi:hypothetical protein|tara:strand:- start:137 stop:253 length:117 start_codon:yes stop_codon:yes gene_type:complete